MRPFARFALLVPVALLASASSFSMASAPIQDAPMAEAATARTEFEHALARSAKENRRVLVCWEIGGGQDRVTGALETALGKSDVRRKLMYEYDVVRIDAWTPWSGEFALRLGLEHKDAQLPPTLSVLDSGGRLLANSRLENWTVSDSGAPLAIDGAKLMEFLTQHQAPYLDAAKVRDAAFARAKAENKRVFLHFGAPWCGWCHKLEGWMERPEVAPLLAKQFVDLKIDTDRMTGGADMLKAARTAAGLKEEGGIPWFVFYDADGKALANSEGPKGNVGYPYQDDEIAFFVTMLEAARTNLTDDDIAKLRESMVAVRREDEEKKAAAKLKSAGAR